MKMLLGLLALTLSVASFASSSDSRTFVYDGTQNSVELILNTEKTHTEYRNETYHTTCPYTETYYSMYCEPSGTQRVCVNTPQGVVCHNRHVPGRCYNRPYYRTVYRPCVQSRQIPFEVKDYDVQARVIVDVTNTTNELSSGERITAVLSGDSLDYSVSGSKRFFILQNRRDERAAMNGSVKMIDALLAVTLVDATKVLSAVRVNGLSVSGNVLKVDTTATAEELSSVFYSLKVERKKLLGDKVIFNRELSASEIEVNGSEGQIDLSKLGIKLDGKNEITVSATVKLNGKLLNSSQFSNELSSSKTLVFKN